MPIAASATKLWRNNHAAPQPLQPDGWSSKCPHPRLERERTVIRLPSFEKVRNDPVLYAHANRVLLLMANPR